MPQQATRIDPGGPFRSRRPGHRWASGWEPPESYRTRCWRSCSKKVGLPDRVAVAVKRDKTEAGASTTEGPSRRFWRYVDFQLRKSKRPHRTQLHCRGKCPADTVLSPSSLLSVRTIDDGAQSMPPSCIFCPNPRTRNAASTFGMAYAPIRESEEGDAWDLESFCSSGS